MSDILSRDESIARIKGILKGKSSRLEKLMPVVTKDSRLNKVIALAAATTETNPSGQQKESGNYRKGRFKMRGLEFVIENPQGSIRSGLDNEGHSWSTVMPFHYGYILKTTSDADGDHLDVYIGPYPESDKVYAVDQSSKTDGKFDEHKFMIGFLNKQSARQAYEDSFDGNAPFMGMVEMTWTEFKDWIEFGDSSAPIVDQMLREFNSRVELLKSVEEPDGSVYLYGACMVPNLVDRSEFRDYYTEDEVRLACYDYMEKSQKAGYHHKGILLSKDAFLVESYLLLKKDNINGRNLPKGSWIVKFKLVHKELIRLAKAGKLAAFSIGGESGKWRLEKRDGTHSEWFGPNSGK